MKPNRASGAGALILLLGVGNAARGASPASKFYPVTPCRAVDTRNAAGPYGGPALDAGAPRDFALAGICGTRTGATALAANVTVTSATNAGELSIRPAEEPNATTSSLSYGAGKTRANNALLTLGPGGVVTVRCLQGVGTAHVIIDVVGYFADNANDPPAPNAGADQQVPFGTVVNLAGSAADDGQPGGPLAYAWKKSTGPGTPSFGSPGAASSTVTFDVAGTYVLQLQVSDGQKTGVDYVTVRVDPAANDLLRFAEQGAFGPSPDLLTELGQKGFTQWVEDQFDLPSSGWGGFGPMPGTRNTTTCPDGTPCPRDNYSLYLVKRRFFTNGLYAPDQLRLRVVWALHKILVVSGRDVSMPYRFVPYLNVLDRNAFGNFRQMLEEITLNPAMGQYLDMATSTKTNPNENYPREIMQLFSVGLEKLNADGTVQVDGSGVAIPTYTQDDVEGLTKVFTGWSFAAQPVPGVTNYESPMVLTDSRHDTGAKTFLGQTIPAGQTGAKDLKDAIDVLFNHPNTGPFICKQLIQQLVTSNPSPAYVGRVSAVFADNGAAVRGDMKSVVRAILFDPEARGAAPVATEFGHLREPALFMLAFLRAGLAKSNNLAGLSDGYMSGLDSNMGQDVLSPATVFSYFMPDGEAPGTGGLLGPEFGILTASTALRRANFVSQMLYGSGTGQAPGTPTGISASTGADTGSSSYRPNGTAIDIAYFSNLGVTGGTTAVLDESNRLFLKGAMSPAMRTAIQSSLAGMTDMTAIARQVLYLVGTSSQFQVER